MGEQPRTGWVRGQRTRGHGRNGSGAWVRGQQLHIPGLSTGPRAFTQGPGLLPTTLRPSCTCVSHSARCTACTGMLGVHPPPSPAQHSLPFTPQPVALTPHPVVSSQHSSLSSPHTPCHSAQNPPTAFAFTHPGSLPAPAHCAGSSDIQSARGCPHKLAALSPPPTQDIHPSGASQ